MHEARWTATGRVVCAAALLGIALASCSSSGTSVPATHTVDSNQPGVAFVQADALAANGTIPAGRSALLNCGSNVYGWLSELTHVGISDAKVARHWGAFVPSDSGAPNGADLLAKQMMASGTIDSPSPGATDVPFDHPYGGDDSFDEKLAPAYDSLDQAFPAAGQSTWPAGVIHDEIQTGLIPHAPGTDQITNGETWPAFATADLSDFAPGFEPQGGDSAAVMGSWVTDCGHQDFHPELHSISFVAFGHKVGQATVAHAFYNPYEVSQFYNPTWQQAGKVTDTATLASTKTQNVLKYIVTAIARLAFGQDPAATMPQMLVPFTASPAPWLVCAPAGSSGTHLAVSYDFIDRPGVSVSVKADDQTGCATVTTSIASSYVPLDAPDPTLCPTPWSWLNANAFGNGGVGRVNVPQIILAQVRKISPAIARALAPKVGLPVMSVCFPPLTVSGLPSPGTGVHTVTTDSAQAYPFIGWVRVAWS